MRCREDDRTYGELHAVPRRPYIYYGYHFFLAPRTIQPRHLECCLQLGAYGYSLAVLFLMDENWASGRKPCGRVLLSDWI